MDPSSEPLVEAWDNFCDTLKETGKIPVSGTAPVGSQDRAAGFRLLARNISLALRLCYENNDPLNPELIRFFDPIQKICGDNQDGLYVYAPINGQDTYRLSGKLGSASRVSFSVYDSGARPWGGPLTAVMSGDDLHVDPDGTFELIISPAVHPGNWLKSGPDSFRLLIRQFFGDWEMEQPMKARIERIAGCGLPGQLTAQGLAKGLRDSANWLQETVVYFSELIEKWRAERNNFLSFAQIYGISGNTPGGDALTCYWEIPNDEALIIRGIPSGDYWSLEFGNYWWETMDYRYRLSGTNMHYAKLEDDGELILVATHDDPGLPNWLDASGFSAGYMTYRWMGSDDGPSLTCKQVKRAELLTHLPAMVKKMTPAQRRTQIAERRRGVQNRFPY